MTTAVPASCVGTVLDALPMPMLAGVGLVSTLSASAAAYFLGQDGAKDLAAIEVRLDRSSRPAACLGYGIQPPLASWGNMLNNAQSYFASAPWVAIVPGVMITLALTGFNFRGDGLRDALDPRHARTRA